MMLKLVAKSKRGRKQLARHGDKWMPVEANRSVSCLGGVPGIKLMSIKDRATFWMRVEGDENLIPVARLDNFGNPIVKSSVVPADMTSEPGEALSATEPPKETIGAAEAMKRQVDKLVLKGGMLSGRFSATGGPNESYMPKSDPADAGHEASQPDPVAARADDQPEASGVEVLLRAG
jgi:hypothetical protein